MRQIVRVNRMQERFALRHGAQPFGTGGWRPNLGRHVDATFSAYGPPRRSQVTEAKAPSHDPRAANTT